MVANLVCYTHHPRPVVTRIETNAKKLLHLDFGHSISSMSIMWLFWYFIPGSVWSMHTVWKGWQRKTGWKTGFWLLAFCSYSSWEWGVYIFPSIATGIRVDLKNCIWKVLVYLWEPTNYKFKRSGRQDKMRFSKLL